MKTLHRLLLLMMVACAAQLAQAYEYFNIYFHDGRKSEPFYSASVDSIRYSKVDIDSMVYNTWTVQEIWCPDSVYRYRIADIDSLGFVDVNTDQVAQNLAHVGAYIIPLYMECNSSFELEECVRSTVMQMDGVEDLWADNQSLFVKIRDYGATAYTYPPTPIAPVIEQAPKPNFLNTRIKEQTGDNTIHKHIHKDVKNICVVTQMRKDDEFKEQNKAMDEMSIKLTKFGYNVTPLPLNDLNVEFFRDNISDYEIMILNTHGMYVEGTHWLATAEEIYSYEKGTHCNEELLKLYAKEFIRTHYYDKGYSPDQVKTFYVPEKRDGKNVIVCYTWISSKLIGQKNDQQSDNIILFNAACQSMKDNDEMAIAFGRKGVGFYTGYTEIDRWGINTNIFAATHLLAGNSIVGAISRLPYYCKSEQFEYPEKSGNIIQTFLEVWKKDLSNELYCISPVKTVSVQYEVTGVTLNGAIQTINPYDIENYGFLIGETPELDETNGEFIDIDIDKFNYNEDKCLFEFSATINYGQLQPGKTYYYRAVLFDGESYCLGDVREFKSSENLIEIYVMASQNPHLYVWFNEFENGPSPVVEPCGSWPGILMTRKKIINGVTYWYACFDYDYIDIIFNNGFIPEEGQPNYQNQSYEKRLFRGAHFFTYDGGHVATEIFP